MKNKYIFILTITVFSSFFLSLASVGFKSKKDKNIEIDKKKNILSSIGIDISDFDITDIDTYFKKNIDTLIINLDGDVQNGIEINNLLEVENKSTGETKFFYDGLEYLPFYLENKKNVIIMPVSGKGLWSSLFGYFAIDGLMMSFDFGKPCAARRSATNCDTHRNPLAYACNCARRRW